MEHETLCDCLDDDELSVVVSLLGYVLFLCELTTYGSWVEGERIGYGLLVSWQYKHPWWRKDLSVIKFSYDMKPST